MPIQIISTADKSHTLYHTEVNEHYHSLRGAKGESMHVFIRHGLEMAAHTNSRLKILEIGFGTGLNALLTWQMANKIGLEIHYVGIDTLPLPEEIYAELNYQNNDDEFEVNYLELMRAPWGEAIQLTQNFTLHKIQISVTEFAAPDNQYQLIYYDAFAPTKQPEMWTADIMHKMYQCCTPGGILVSYCAQSNFKRHLKAAGFTVEPLPGALGKREMTRAIKPL